jgi:replicative DNA helicase
MTVAAENVIGGLLVDPTAYWRVADILRAEHFTGDLRPLFERIAKAAKEGERYDAVDAADDGYTFALDLVNHTPGAGNIVGWARRVADTSEVGKVRDAGSRIAQCDSYDDALALLAAVRPEQAARVKSVQDGLAEMVETLQARFNAGGKVTGVPTGVDSLDELTGGWQPGNLIVLVGETSMGKSALALQSALAAAKYGKTCGKSALYYSLEMTAGELTERAVANLANFPLRWMTSPADAPEDGMDRVTHGSRLLSDLPLMIDDQCGLSLEKIVSRSTQLHMHQPLAAIFVDYMHIMDRPRRNDVAELGGISTGLKNLSKTLAVPVIALHQLNRSNAAVGRDSRRPTIFDIRASGEIAETANTVIAIYRSEIARPDFAPLQGYAEALVLKQRQGRRDVRAWMKSRLANMRFESCDAPEGYDDTITKDIEPDSGPGSNGGNGGGAARGNAGIKPRPVSPIRGDH